MSRRSITLDGSTVYGGGAREDIKVRMKKANQTITALNKIWASEGMNEKLKIHVFISDVKSLLLYSPK